MLRGNGSAMATPQDHPIKSLGHKELVVLTALLMALHSLAIDGMLPALDEIAREFRVADPNQRQYVVGLFLLSTGAGSLIPGLLADRFGRK